MYMQWIEIDFPMVCQFIICSLRAQSIHILLFQSLNNGHFENIRDPSMFFPTFDWEQLAKIRQHS